MHSNSLDLTILIGFNQNIDEKEMIIVKIRLTDKTKGDLNF